MSDTVNFILKIIVIGEPATGKTSLVKKYISGHFSQDYRASIGTNMYIKKVKLDSGDDAKIQLWDIAGQEKWIKMRHVYYRGAQGALVLGDLTREKSFYQIESFWREDLLKYCPNIPIILIGNKNDLKMETTKEKVESVGKKLGAVSVIYTSAKTGDNVKQAFKTISEIVYKKRLKVQS
ncbi:MAG: GTP-binding protein [Promethearchaeota archaeon]